jgi:type I restriction enzyme, S subunit
MEIALILSKVDELIQKTDQVIKQSQRLQKGLMQRLLTKGIGHTNFKKRAVVEIPENRKSSS